MTKKMTDDEVMTVGQVARLLRMSEHSIHSLCNKGMLDYWRHPLGNKPRRFLRSNVLAFGHKCGIPVNGSH